MNKIKILIVDDHPMMREALQTAFEGEDDLEMIGEAPDAIKALKMLETIKPDVIMMDLLLPKMSGLEAIEKIMENDPNAKILVLSSMENEERVVSAIQAGALGYFPKTAPRTYLLEAIRKVADGIPYLPSGITLKLFQGLRRSKMAPLTDNTQESLTSRQQEILSLLAEGHSDDEIAKLLHLEESTVRAHIHNILRRLGLKNRTQAVAYAHHHLKAE
ncbi:MAG: response regulator transcription factor [Anaerolineales bacterium]|jgi:NarL family two-component system response regulator LiaR|nr:response regulator transcription factor [Anaerolineales bacterium]